ncbi:MAG TPA: adenylate/guanylate cyclase domain-containing protein [Gaiellaceae bacterium]|nr:adenylate/guanylate cyclase domain-containing protein [Gaiellaceae bacterium]
MRELPAGTVTLLFTDVEGSTALLHSLGDEYADALAEHRRILRAAFTKRGGVEVDTQGDAFFYAFTRAGDAVEAASVGQDSLAEGPLRVRIGVHTGEPLVTAEGYVGIDVHRAARIAAAAHGGQVVISQTTRDLIDDSGLRDLGVHRLKDLTAPERLYQLGDDEFPPLRTLDATNLPVTASPLLGREQELAELVALLSDGTRLVTVTGPGGTGKTRLALQVAAELVGTFSGGVFWAPLAGLADPELVVPEIARTLPARDDLVGYLRGKQLLLLLDNFEHLLAAAPELAALLAAADGLRVIVTSRAPLRISGEREYPLEPLPPEDAVTLFLERARGVGKDFAPSPTIESICLRLDGLPLAIELAAARTKLLSPDALLERLDRALSLLTGGARDAPERQRTLRATIEWSHDLLDEESKRLFARLSVFLGSFPLAVAEEVCDADLDAVSALVDLSLLKPIAEDRFLMLETIREYAAERLEASGEADEFRRRHTDAFRSLAAECYARRVDAEAECSERLESDHDDLRAALEWLAAHDPDAELELAGALGWFWFSHSHLPEGRRRLTEALARSPVGGSVRAAALTAVGGIAGWQGDADRGPGWVGEGIALWRELGDVAELAYALETLGWVFFVLGDNLPGLAAFEESLELRRTSGDVLGEMRALAGVCQMLVAEGEVDRAEPLSRELLELARDRGDPRAEHWGHHFLGDCALIRGDCDDSEDLYRASLRAALPLADILETSFEVQGVGMSAAGRGDWARGLRLVAAGYAMWESIGATLEVPFWNALLDRYAGVAREGLGLEAEAVWAEGHALPFDEAVTLALG